MRRNPMPHVQRCATLVVGLIMLVLITLMVTAAFMLSNSNLRAVGNMQFRDEAVAAANIAIERTFALANLQNPHTDFVDINRDATNDFSVSLVRTCIRSTNLAVPPAPGSGSSVTLGLTPPPNEYLVLWDYDATVSDAATGASARVRQGIRQRLTQAQCDLLCPPPGAAACS